MAFPSYLGRDETAFMSAVGQGVTDRAVGHPLTSHGKRVTDRAVGHLLTLLPLMVRGKRVTDSPFLKSMISWSNYLINKYFLIIYLNRIIRPSLLPSNLIFKIQIQMLLKIRTF